MYVYVCVRFFCGPVPLCSNRSWIGLGMAARSLVHHTSQPQPLSAGYKFQSRLQIMTKDVVAGLEDVQQNTYAHSYTHINTRTQTTFGMRQCINVQSINTINETSKQFTRLDKPIYVFMQGCWIAPPLHSSSLVHHTNLCTGTLNCFHVQSWSSVLLIFVFSDTFCLFLRLLWWSFFSTIEAN